MAYTTVTPAQRDAVSSIRLRYGSKSAAWHAFHSLFLWQDTLKLSILLDVDFYAVRYGAKGDRAYFMPCGAPEKVMQYLESLKEHGSFRLFNLCEADKAFLETQSPGQFQFRYDRDNSEYLYDIEKSCDLSGKQNKYIRRDIRSITEAHLVETEPLTAQNISTALQIVSGKGVPAALFMVIAKTLIRNQALFGLPPEKVFSKVNMQLCENNKGKMFVTAWMGILKLSTGKVIYANAGHTRPVIARSSGACEYLKGRANFVLAGMPMMQYTQGELQLNPGDTLFLYTDGVTEATDASEELFGEARLLETVSAHPTDKPQDMIAAVKDAIDGFVKDAPQFDDITMLAVQYKGEESGVYTETKTFIAAKKELNALLEWLEKLLEAHDCPMKVQTQLNIAVEEIFVNIASYAYPQGTSTADITCHFSGSSPTKLEITFADKGVPYDPLKKNDPNTKLGADERQIGGLGIFMVKQSMDNVRYKYENGQNVLTITKSWE